MPEALIMASLTSLVILLQAEPHRPEARSISALLRALG